MHTLPVSFCNLTKKKEKYIQKRLGKAHIFKSLRTLTHDDLDLVSSDRLNGLQVVGRDGHHSILVRKEDGAHA